MLNENTVDFYIENSNEKAIPILKELRKIIMEIIPDAEEGINYSIPYYKYFGDLAGFATYKTHVSFGYGAQRDRSGKWIGPVLQSNDIKQLKDKGYKLGKGTLQIRFDQKVPVDEIKMILITKADMNKSNYSE